MIIFFSLSFLGIWYVRPEHLNVLDVNKQKMGFFKLFDQKEYAYWGMIA